MIVAVDYANTLIRSKIGSKIALFLFILLFLVIINFVIVSYYQSQMAYLGNSINVAGKNRFLASNLMLHISEYLNMEDNTKSNSVIKSAMHQLESNILALRHGGNLAGIDLRPLPRDFLEDWNIIYQKCISLKANVTNKIIKSNNGIMNSEKSIDIVKEASLLQTEALSLIDSSNLLVTKLSDYLNGKSEYSLFIQQIFTILIIAVTVTFALYISSKILRPIISLTSAISEINGERLNVMIGQNKANNNNNNELLVLSNSFHSMVNYIKNITIQDKLIKELEKSNEELKYKDQLKNDFINTAAHEIKTPIQPIIALADILQQEEGIIDIEKNKEYLDIISRNSKRLKKITDDVLDIARIENGSFSLIKEKFNLKELIMEILKEYEQKIKRNNSNIKLLYEFFDISNEIIIEADRNRLSQVIHNLLNNALKFTKKGSITVIVETKKDNKNDKQNEVLISIKDTGTGIHPDILPKLFTKFVTKSPIPGTGLGLFISKSIIEMHGGKIWAINNNEKNKEYLGSTFTFSLPIE